MEVLLLWVSARSQQSQETIKIPIHRYFDKRYEHRLSCTNTKLLVHARLERMDLHFEWTYNGENKIKCTVNQGKFTAGVFRGFDILV